jgi:peptide/nickel transport system permease protein
VRAYLARRLAQGVAVVILVVTATFALIRLAPGDPFASSLDSPAISQEVRDAWRARYAFDRPIPEQYRRYVINVATGDFGWSTSQKRPVRDVIAGALPNTLLLMFVALVASFAAGISLGVLQAVHRGAAADRIASAATLLFYSMPDFWLALMMMLTFAYWIPLFPVTGMTDALLYQYWPAWRQLLDRLHHLVLPAATLTLLSMAVIARYQRSAMLDVIHDEYIRTARAKGLDERRVMRRHALRNALLPTITLFGLSFPALLGGAVFVERIFSWPGMGMLTVTAISQRDYHLVTAAVVVGSGMVVVGSLLADILSAVVDPRLRRV